MKEDVLRNVTIKGNKYLHEAHVRRALPALKTGAAINTKNLDRQILVANDNPSRCHSLQTIDVGIFDAVVSVSEDKLFRSHCPWTIRETATKIPFESTIGLPMPVLVIDGMQQEFYILRSPSNSIRQYLAYYNQPLSSQRE